MRPSIYDELTPWYRLLDPPADHEDEGTFFRDALVALRPDARTLLELGSGAGNNALFMKQRFVSTLSDLSPAMLALSREQNPECEHVLGDMRELRLGRQFDVVFVHDAIAYMLTETDLVAAMRTAFEHLVPGGVAMFVPDCLRDGFAEQSELLERDEGGRSLRGLAWTWDADPGDSSYNVEYALLLRDGKDVRAVHDRHIEGLFARQTWLGGLASAGFVASAHKRTLDDGGLDEYFVGARPR